MCLRVQNSVTKSQITNYTETSSNSSSDANNKNSKTFFTFHVISVFRVDGQMVEIIYI